MGTPRTPRLPALATNAVAPPGLASQVAQVTAELGRAPGVLAVILLGSVARGEASIGLVDGRTELFSDLELLAVTDGRLPRSTRQALTANARGVAAGFGYRSRLFHVDVLCRERRRLASLPPIIFTFELKATGRPLWGRDVLGEVREVTLANLDRRNTHEILMKRLWALAEAIPAAWVRGQELDAVAARSLSVALWRNPLDVTTALLPDAGILLPTYRQRVERWSAEPRLAVRAALDQSLGIDSAGYLADCLERRRQAIPAVDLADDHAAAVRCLVAGLAWTMGTSPERVADALPAASPRVFHERPIAPGEWWAVGRHGLTLASRQGPAAAVRWWLAPRKGLLAAALVQLHQAIEVHDGVLTPQVAACQAAAQLARAAAGDPEPAATVTGAAVDGTTAWLAARRAVARSFWRVIRLGDPLAWQQMTAAMADPLDED